MTHSRIRGWAAALLVLGGLWACGDSDGAGGGNGGSAGNGGTGGSAGSGGVGASTGGDGGTSGSGGVGATGGSGGSGADDGGVEPNDAGGTGGSDAGTWAPLDVCEPGASYGHPLPAPANRTATLVKGGFKFLEGPVWHARDGVLFFSDMDMGSTGPNGIPSKIWKLTPPDTTTEFVASSGSNGLALTKTAQDVLLACTHDTQALTLFNIDSNARTDLPITIDGDTFNSPNDLVERSDGIVYFTDPDWQLPPRTSQTGGVTGVYLMRTTGTTRTVTLVDDALDKPNGIALSPDGTTLYVGSTSSNVYSYTLDPITGAASNKAVFVASGAADGFAMDCAGNLYVTTGGTVKVYASDKMYLGEIDVPENPANVAFGGPDKQTLYITARTGLYAIHLNVPGYPY